MKIVHRIQKYDSIFFFFLTLCELPTDELQINMIGTLTRIISHHITRINVN